MRKKKLIAITIIFFFIFTTYSHAFLSIEILSFGPFSLELSLNSTASILLGVAAIGYTLFSGFFSSAHSYSGNSTYVEPVIETKHSIIINISDPRKKNSLELLLRDIIQDDKILLTDKGYLEIAEDGKMIFRNTRFHGYMFLHYDKSLTVWNEKNEVLLVVKRKDDKLYFLQRHGNNCSELIKILFTG